MTKRTLAKPKQIQPTPHLLTPLILLLLTSPTLLGACNPAQPNCANCTSAQLCNLCDDSFFLDILNKSACIDCPTACNECDKDGCTTCIIQYYIKEETVKDMKINYCLPCSEECDGCSGRADYCTSCREYYQLNELDGTCQFKYARLIVFGVILITILLMIMVFLIVKCVCFEKPPEKPEFGSILDKDPELLSDHFKVDRETIGVNSKFSDHDASILSNVKKADDSYLDISRMSQDPIMGELLAPKVYIMLGGEMRGDEPQDGVDARLRRGEQKRRVNTGLR